MFEFCSCLVDLVVGVGRLTEDIVEVGDRGGDFGDPTAARGLRAKPAIVAAGS